MENENKRPPECIVSAHNLWSIPLFGDKRDSKRNFRTWRAGDIGLRALGKFDNKHNFSNRENFGK